MLLQDDLRYTKSHEWVAQTENGTVRLGLTDHAQEAMGDLVYVELPEPGDTFSARNGVAVI